MADQLYFEDVQEGTEVTPLVKTPSTRTLVQYAGASGDFFELHYDKDFAQALGFPSVIIHGRLGASFITQMLTDWVGEKGSLRKVSVSYRGNAFPGKPYTCKGKVIKKYVENGENLVDLEIWGENHEGKLITPGSATVVLPSKG